MTETKNANHSATHKSGINAIRKALGRELDLTLWENSKVQIVRGEARAMPGLVKGASDLLGLLSPNGRLIAWECKTGKAVPTEEQRMFLDLVRKRGGFACILHFDSDEQAIQVARDALARARAGESE